MPAAIVWTLAAGATVALACLAAAVLARARRARTVGAVVWRSANRRAGRLAFSVAALALLVLAVGREPAGLGPALVLLLASLACAWLAPGADERVCGLEGVAVGWDAARYEDLAEWRLLGDHLRFRTGEEWRAVDLPRAEQAAVRARLAVCCAERESPFSSDKNG